MLLVIIPDLAPAIVVVPEIDPIRDRIQDRELVFAAVTGMILVEVGMNHTAADRLASREKL